ncbi:bifunctional protein-serine/threonine kinase/phosphatase [Enterovibrio baiacu]|uniref:bifunctional protein-serine/threonine kinase/phosphatase n=1 Tax=Enterovibrio baiacu TaxID=2491023 RepID=UPI0010101EF2|nr:bifunctional protein-serine/threonine kinase/phosphatase [Enterovibrio baiacu]MBE1275733.1 bifunctional protein-serine/threonine kinase/phosphatase [Enterovibrio baiacu]
MKPEVLSTPYMASNAAKESEKLASRLVVRAGGGSVAGRKPPNQDAFAVKIPSNLSELKHKGVVATIADGVSSSEVSQKASETSVTEFINDYMDTPNTWSVKSSAGAVLKSINHWLFHHAKQDGEKSNAMVAAFTGVVIKSNTAHLFHMGDCRVYLLRDKTLTQLTQDHRRYTSKTQHHLTRALGIDSHLEVDYKLSAVQAGDVLLMTTDGVHDALSEKDILTFLKGKVCGQDESLETVATALVDKALAAGSDDNISCLFLAIDALPKAAFDEAFRHRAEQVIPPVLLEGQQIDHFQIKRVIYSGSRSHLYLARSTQDDKQYVLKMPSQNFADDDVYLSGFIREGWIGEQVRQRGVMKIHPQTWHSRFLYHVCDYVDGMTLRQWMLDNPTPTLTQIRTLAKGAIRSMRVLQRMAVVHRDIKPDNLMVDKDMNLVLIDYGTAQAQGLEELSGHVEESYPVGDLNYAAPEYLKGNKATLSSDVYSLGVTFYEMLTGHLPFKPVNASNPRASNRQTYTPAVVFRPDVPDWFDAALKKACHSIPSARYDVLSEFEQDLLTPNRDLEKTSQQRAMIEKDPVRFWKGLSVVLFTMVMLLTALLVQA